LQSHSRRQQASACGRDVEDTGKLTFWVRFAHLALKVGFVLGSFSHLCSFVFIDIPGLFLPSAKNDLAGRAFHQGGSSAGCASALQGVFVCFHRHSRFVPAMRCE
jgi:hypothetical protein